MLGIQIGKCSVEKSWTIEGIHKYSLKEKPKKRKPDGRLAGMAVKVYGKNFANTKNQRKFLLEP